LPTLSINTLAIDPATTGAGANLYVGTANNGVWKSTDGGMTWTAVNNGLVIPPFTTPADVSALAIVPGLPVGTAATLYAGGSEGILKSTNGGATWTPLLSTGLPSFPEIQALAIDPVNPNNVYAGASQNFFKSTNGGASWISSNSGLVAPGTTTPLDVKFL